MNETPDFAPELKEEPKLPEVQELKEEPAEKKEFFVDTKPKSFKKREPSPPGQAVSGNSKDEVLLSACVFKNKFLRKSLSIHHVQRRLAELGYAEAHADKDGWYGDLTKSAVKAFQNDEKLNADGVITAETLHKLFSDDPNVVVVA